ncbi:MAG: recombination protein O N-terminal domain-containing protein [Victivallaceae bacterium]|nr:recombination protein O N-terminal domain-containing protein [Victivallaceae bacterium]
MSLIQTSEILVLRKSPYGETSMIIAGITPELGRLDLIIKGGMGGGKTKFPAADIFRELQVEFSESSQSTLHNLRNAEILGSCGEALAAVPDNFTLAIELAALILKWGKPQLPAPEVYCAALNVFNQLSMIEVSDRFAEPKRIRCAVMLKLVLLSENGLLPEYLDRDPDLNVEKHDLMDQILAAAQGLEDPPQNTARFWHKMNSWADALFTNT